MYHTVLYLDHLHYEYLLNSPNIIKASLYMITGLFL